MSTGGIPRRLAQVGDCNEARSKYVYDPPRKYSSVQYSTVQYTCPPEGPDEGEGVQPDLRGRYSEGSESSKGTALTALRGSVAMMRNDGVTTDEGLQEPIIVRQIADFFYTVLWNLYPSCARGVMLSNTRTGLPAIGV